MYHFQCAFGCEFRLQNTLTELGKDVYTIYLKGRIHLTDITKNYKKYQNLSLEEKTNGDEPNTTTDSSAEKEFKAYDPKDCSIKIKDDGRILMRDELRLQHYLSAIAAVDYAMRETKPSCGLVKEFKIISK